MPSDWRRKLKSLAAREGLSVADFLQKDSVAERPTLKEVAERIASRPPVQYRQSPAEILREERDRRSSTPMRNLLGRRTPGLRHPEGY